MLEVLRQANTGPRQAQYGPKLNQKQAPWRYSGNRVCLNIVFGEFLVSLGVIEVVMQAKTGSRQAQHSPKLNPKQAPWRYSGNRVCLNIFFVGFLLSLGGA